MTRLSNLGVVPGATVRLQQRKPAAVLRIGETTLALDLEAAGEIFVDPVARESAVAGPAVRFRA
jgi:Fe2+ transport system protein FeoA